MIWNINMLYYHFFLFKSWKASFVGQVSDWLRNGFVPSKTVIFIWGLVLSHTFVKQAVVNVWADYLTEKVNFSVLQVIVLANLVDGISSLLQVGVLYLSTYTGRFTVIILCTVANTLGLALLRWPGGAGSIFPIALTVFSTMVEEQTLRDFFDYQLSEEAKKKYTENNTGQDKELSEERSDENGSGTTNLWWYAATFSGSVIAFLCTGLINDWSWSQSFFLVTFSVMGAACLLFMCGFFYFYPEKKSGGWPLNTIFMVFKEAIKKSRLSYPSSQEDYYSNSSNEGSNDPNDTLYWLENNEVHLMPRHPSFLKFLDRAAIIRRNSNNAGSEERNESACTAENVREVKSLYPMIAVGFTLFGCSLVRASSNTYFVLQTDNLVSEVGDFNVPITVFFQLSSSVSFGVKTIQSNFKLVKAIGSIGFAMFFTVLCYIVAFLVERWRLHPIRPHKPLSIMVLTPQYLLLGLVRGFADIGIETYAREKVPRSMRPLVDPGIEMLLSLGSFSNVVFTFICRSWIKHSINDEGGHLDWYFIVLAALSFVLFGIYVWYAKFKLSKN